MLLPSFEGDSLAEYFKEMKSLNKYTVMDTAWDKDGKWLDVIYNYPVPMPDTGKFENVSHLVTVPPGAYKMSVQLSGSNQGVGDTGEVVFTGAQLIKY